VGVELDRAELSKYRGWGCCVHSSQDCCCVPASRYAHHAAVAPGLYSRQDCIGALRFYGVLLKLCAVKNVAVLEGA
jgi:hypothetical protein